MRGYYCNCRDKMATRRVLGNKYRNIELIARMGLTAVEGVDIKICPVG